MATGALGLLSVTRDATAGLVPTLAKACDMWHPLSRSEKQGSGKLTHVSKAMELVMDVDTYTDDTEHFL